MSTKSQGLLKSEQDLEAMVESLKAGKQLQRWSIGVQPETKMQVVAALQDVVYTIRELNTLEGHSDSVTSVSFSPKGQRVISGSKDKTLILWSLDGKKIATFKGHENEITIVRFSPNGKLIASGSADKTVKIWSLDGKVITTFKGHKDSITSLSFSPDSQKVVSGSADGTIKLWSLDNKEIARFKGHEYSITSVSFSPDGKLIASSSADQSVKISSLDGKEIKTWNLDSVTNVSFSPDGKLIASSNHAGVTLWRRDGSLFKTLRNNTAENQSLSFSRDGQTIAVASPGGSGDNKIRVDISQIDTKDKASFALTGHKNQVTSVSFSPNLQMLVSGSQDNTVKIWSLESRGFKTPMTIT